ncbi:MAG: SDR family oxidoreductase [Longimicrobiaceae bacterium]
MGVSLKPVREQVIVITGADSGIGLATAQLAARRGARLVLCSRNAEELARIGAELRGQGAEVEWYAADVADGNEMLRLAEVAIQAFGRIDSWINNAGVSIYGLIEDVPVEDAQRMFDTNYWGVVNGTLAALPYLRANGGALINVGSIVSDTVVPLQGHYSASKHAVKGFTDALRVELEHDNAPISVTLVKPGAIDTPFPEHAANYMDAEAQHPKPVYAPQVVARAILHCAEHPRRSVTVGGGGRMMAMMGMAVPGLADRMNQTMFSQQKRKKPGRLPQEETLWEPPAHTSGRTRGDQPGRIHKTSAYTAATLHPGRTALALVAAGLGYAIATGGGGLLRRGRGRVEADTRFARLGMDSVDDPDIDVQIHRAPRFDDAGEAVLENAAAGDRYVP